MLGTNLRHINATLTTASQIQMSSATESNSTLTTVTASGSTHTKGSWIQLIASSNFAATLIGVQLRRNGAITTNYLVDIGTGASGSETVLIPDILLSNSPSTTIWLPLSIANGVRLSVRCQSNVASASVEAQLILANPTITTRSVVTAYGVNSATTRGVTFDPGGTANTKPGYTQIVASTSNTISEFIVMIGGGGNPAPAQFGFLIDFAAGGAGSEAIVVDNLFVRSDPSNNTFSPAVFAPLQATIASGTRLAVNAQCSNTDATDRQFDIVIYGMS